MRIAIVILALAGCAAQARQMQQARVDLLTKRASFDLSCAPEALKITCLNGARAVGDVEICSTAGVEGCGHRATYVMTQTSAAEMQWTMNTSDGQVK